jgi:hypothetical protein
MHKQLGGDAFIYFEVSSLEANDNRLATEKRVSNVTVVSIL